MRRWLLRFAFRALKIAIPVAVEAAKAIAKKEIEEEQWGKGRKAAAIEGVDKLGDLVQPSLENVISDRSAN